MSNRLLLRRPAALRIRPVRARRVMRVQEAPVEYSTERSAPRWLIVGAGVLGALVTVEAVVGIAVLA